MEIINWYKLTFEIETNLEEIRFYFESEFIPINYLEIK